MTQEQLEFGHHEVLERQLLFEALKYRKTDYSIFELFNPIANFSIAVERYFSHSAAIHITYPVRELAKDIIKIHKWAA